MKIEIRYMKIFSSFPASLLASSRSPSLYTPPARFPRPPCSSHALFLPSSHYSCFSCPFRRDYLRYMKTDLRYMDPLTEMDLLNQENSYFLSRSEARCNLL